MNVFTTVKETRCRPLKRQYFKAFTARIARFLYAKVGTDGYCSTDLNGHCLVGGNDY